MLAVFVKDGSCSIKITRMAKRKMCLQMKAFILIRLVKKFSSIPYSCPSLSFLPCGTKKVMFLCFLNIVSDTFTWRVKSQRSSKLSFRGIKFTSGPTFLQGGSHANSDGSHWNHLNRWKCTFIFTFQKSPSMGH